MTQAAVNERVEITPEHLSQIRGRFKDCEGMSDEQLIEALLLYERMHSNILGCLCFPRFDCCLHFIKRK